MQVDKNSFRLSEPLFGVELFAEADGVWLRGDLALISAEACSAASTRLGRLLWTTTQQLLEGGFASSFEDGVQITFSDFVSLQGNGIDSFADLAVAAPFTLEIQSSGWPGGPSFKYSHRFYQGVDPVYPERIGCFLRYDQRLYQLDSQTFFLLSAIESFNSLPAENKTSNNAFIRFAEIKGLAKEVGVQLDRFLTNEKVLIASRVGLDLVADHDGKISFVPKIDGVPAEAMRHAFFASDDAESIYSVDDGQGGKVRVVLDDEQREVLRRMQRVRHLGGAERTEVLRNPHQIFDSVSNQVDISPELFGPRVKGIGDFPFVVQPYLRHTGESLFEDGPGTADANHSPRAFDAGLNCKYIDGSTEDVAFTNKAEAIDLYQKTQNARLAGLGVVEFRGKSIALEDPFVKGLAELVRANKSQSEHSTVNSAQRRYLLIYTNEEAVDYDESPPDEISIAETSLPRALRTDRALKEHQLAGLSWLQRSYSSNRRGCLLADDMGLGKTLQVLSFLAWLIEQGGISENSEDSEKPPWNPILVVMPLVLLENEIWQNDMREFFEHQGSVFQPWLVLRGQELNKLKRPEVKGQRETIDGLPVLDVSKFRNYRVVLTNYETITNYQHSFARSDINWSVVVADEAQQFKTQNTKISHALKCLSPRFRIASTGTPVETRLLDIWNIFDFLQPGKPLTSSAEFTRVFETPYRESGSQSVKDNAVLGSLRAVLKLGQSDAYVMRRDKTRHLAGLPPKREHLLECLLSEEQRQTHLDIMKSARERNVHPFELIHSLMDLYQHPALIPRYEGISATEAIARCPKLAIVVEQLVRIQKRGEKVLVFARRKPIQQLLADVIHERFNLPVEIINGDAKRASSGAASSTRREMIKKFRDSQGFNAIVLSPEVAGVGLTLVEANHVIHYGRWWNPATESQATDRAYRIGQTREVHVYYPIAKDPHNEFVSFDEKLHKIIERRRQMAEEFLTPQPTEADLQHELLDEVFGEPLRGSAE